MTVSAVVLTRSKIENPNLQKCLNSLTWCDEIIVLENDKLTDYSAARNLALEKVKNDWVLFVDDDEIVSRDLANEILQTSDRFDGYYIRRIDYFLGRFLNFGETGSIKLLRLGKKNAGKWQRAVHEFWNIKNTGQLKNPLYHYSHPTIHQFIDSINRYASLDVPELLKEGKRFSGFRLIFNPIGKFIQNYILRLGFLDGEPGFVMAFMMSLQSMIVRVKMYEKSL